MAISQKNYVDIETIVRQAAVSGRDFSTLVFTADEILSSAPADIKTAYGTGATAGSVITLSYLEVISYFADTTKVYAFATKYFGYTNPDGRNPLKLNICRMTVDSTVVETPLSAYNRVKESFVDFTAFTFLDGEYNATGAQSAPAGFGAVASANTDFIFVVEGTTSDITAKQALVEGVKNVHVVLGADAYGAWMPCAWIASLNFSQANAIGTIYGKQFGNETATVSTDADKATYDAKKVNYIGLTMYNGGTLKFYQNGENQDGLDLGVSIGEMWLKSRIEQEFMNLLTTMSKIPANGNGIIIIHNMLLEIASDATDNGVILLDKPLTTTDIALINQYSGNDQSAVNAVSNSGYYITTWIEKEGTKYYAKYRLIYAKGDHVHKLEGANILI